VSNEPDERWALRATDRALLGNKSGATRLGFAVLLKVFQAEGRFSRCPEDVPLAAVEAIAGQSGVPKAAWRSYDWNGRAIRYHRAQIRTALGFREATEQDAATLARWLEGQVLTLERRPDRLLTAARERCRTLYVEPPSPERLERLVRSALHRQEEAFCAAILARLPSETVTGLNALLCPPNSGGVEGNLEEGGDRPLLLALRSGTGQARLQSVSEEADKLRRIRVLTLPGSLFDGVPSRVLLAYRRRVAAEELHELRRHPAPIRLTLLAAFCHVREREIADSLTDLLITTVHRIGTKAEKRVEGELIGDLKRVAGKPALLFKLATASIAKPDGSVRDVIFPTVGEQTLHDLVAEGEATGPVYRRHLQAVIHNTYRSHYRRMLPLVLDALDFRSNNQAHRPALDALGIIARHAARKRRLYRAEEDIPLDGVVPAAWRDAVLERDAQGRLRVNRVAYEICALQALREQLRCKEVWVEGADRYRDPDQDLPADFEARRDEHYAALGLPKDASTFINKVRTEMADALAALDRGLARNPYVRILKRGGGTISVTPLERQPEPMGLVALNALHAERHALGRLRLAGGDGFQQRAGGPAAHAGLEGEMRGDIGTSAGGLGAEDRGATGAFAAAGGRGLGVLLVARIVAVFAVLAVLAVLHALGAALLASLLEAPLGTAAGAVDVEHHRVDVDSRDRREEPDADVVITRLRPPVGPERAPHRDDGHPGQHLRLGQLGMRLVIGVGLKPARQQHQRPVGGGPEASRERAHRPAGFSGGEAAALVGAPTAHCGNGSPRSFIIATSTWRWSSTSS